jgi:hypothetical protein
LYNKVIADISCDVAGQCLNFATSTIAEPIYGGYLPSKIKKFRFTHLAAIVVMAVDRYL